MFIKKLTLKNFRCFENLEIDFEEKNGNRARTLILGENGTGKSNILKSIALVTAGSSALGELLGNVNDWIRYKTKECRIDLELTTKKKETRHIWLEMHRDDTLIKVINRSHESLSEIDDALDHADRNYFVVGYGASRISGSGSRIRSKSQESQRSQCVASLLDKSAELNSLEEWAIDLDYRNEGSGGLDIIRKVFNDFLPNTKFIGIDRKTRRLMLETADGIIPFEALSDGYQNVAAWIGDMLYRINDIFYDRKDPLKTRGVLLIDEIALHLHPMWQRRILAFIQKTLPNMQLIATTHSPFIAQQAGKGELFTLERIEKTLQIDCFSGNPQELLLHQLIMSDVFGMQTDESIYVEKLRTDRDKLLNRKRRSTTDNKSLKKLEISLKDIPIKSYSNSLITDEDRETMREILKSYNKK